MADDGRDKMTASIGIAISQPEGTGSGIGRSIMPERFASTSTPAGYPVVAPELSSVTGSAGVVSPDATGGVTGAATLSSLQPALICIALA